MSIWIVAALKTELELLRSKLNARFQGWIAGFPCYHGEAGQEPVRLGVLGVGIASASLSLGAFFGSETPEIAIMVGTAGALPGWDLTVGDMVVAESEILAELGVVRGPGIGDTTPLDTIHLVQEIPFDRQLTNQVAEAAGRTGPLRRGKMITVVGVTGRPEQAEGRVAHFKALAENMEGYGLALAGRQFDVRTAEVRGISNQAGDRDKSRWDFKLAQERAQSAVWEYLRRRA